MWKTFLEIYNAFIEQNNEKNKSKLRQLLLDFKKKTFDIQKNIKLRSEDI